MPNYDTLKQEMKKDGYSKEDAYFARVDRALMDRLAERRQGELKRQQWMKCPSCGCQLKEEILFDTITERCEACHGVFLDADAAKALLKAPRPKTLVTRLKRLFALKDQEASLF